MLTINNYFKKQNFKKIIPLLLSLIIFIFIIYLWDSIKLPYNENNTVLGEYYEKKINPLNDTIRFLIIIGFPTLIYLLFYLRLEKKTFSLKNNKEFFLYKKVKVPEDSLNSFSIIFFIIIILEFLSLNFQDFIHNLDIFHEGTYLIPPMNYLKTNEFFKSTLYDYGLIANNIGYFYYKLFGYYTPGSIIFIKLFFILLLKFSLILISAKLIKYLFLKKTLKIIFFIFFTFILINFPNYYDLNSYFSPRVFLYTFFLYFLGNELEKISDFNLKYLLIGSFSLVSIMWWWDIGAYLNALLLVLLTYLIYDRQYKNFLIVLIGIILPWFIFFFSISYENFNEFILQLKIPYSEYWEYLLGIEYKKPFSSNSGRWTKAITFIYLSSIFLINFNFSKSYKISFKTKIFVNLIFIASLLIFKSSLMRSDAYHLKYVSGLYTLIFLYLFLFNLINFMNKDEKFNKFFLIKKKQILIYIIFFILIFLNQIHKNGTSNLYNKINNVINFKQNIYSLTSANPEVFLTKKTKEIIKFYKKISENDKCVQIMTDDISFSYYLEKKTCTQFYIPSQIIKDLTEQNFIDQLKKSSPEIILFDSTQKLLSNKKNMPNAIKYINNNYSFYKSYEEYVFYKKN